MDNIKLLLGLSKDSLDYVEGVLERKVFFHDDIICKEGDKGDELYLISRGKVDVLKKGIKVGELESGGSFGEMSLLEGKERSADVVANGEVVLYILNKKTFLKMRKEEPLIYADIVYNVSIDLSKKLRDITSRLQRIWEGYISSTD